MSSFSIDQFTAMANTSRPHYGASYELPNGDTRCPVTLSDVSQSIDACDSIFIPLCEVPVRFRSMVWTYSIGRGGVEDAKVPTEQIDAMISYLTSLEEDGMRVADRSILRDTYLVPKRIKFLYDSSIVMDRIGNGGSYDSYWCNAGLTIVPVMDTLRENGRKKLMFVATKVTFYN